MPAKLHICSPRLSNYGVGGSTLADLWRSILKKGPKDPNDNKKVAFLTTTELKCLTAKGKYVSDGKAKVDKKTGWYDASAKLKKLDVILMSYIHGPKQNVSGLSKPAAREWKRWYGKAMDHEFTHVKKAAKEAEKILREINALRGTGLADNEADALKQAKEDLMRAINIRIFDDRDRLNDLHAKFDRATKHGATTGATLDTTVL